MRIKLYTIKKYILISENHIIIREDDHTQVEKNRQNYDRTYLRYFDITIITVSEVGNSNVTNTLKYNQLRANNLKVKGEKYDDCGTCKNKSEKTKYNNADNFTYLMS